jgi:hypothetical protein
MTLKGNGGVPAASGPVALVGSVHLTALTGPVVATELVADTGAAGMFLFVCQLTTTTTALSAANASLHVTVDGTVHGQSSSQALEVSPPNSGGAATIAGLNLAQPGDCLSLVSTKFIDANAAIEYSVDADPETYEYALDVAVYRLS